MPKVATYGTLRLGGRLQPYYMKEDQYEGTHVFPGYKIYDLGSYPCAINTDNPDDKIVVDIWDVSEKQFLNMQMMEEGAGYTTYRLPNHKDETYIFLFDEPMGKLIEGGDYLEYLKTKSK